MQSFYCHCIYTWIQIVLCYHCMCTCDGDGQWRMKPEVTSWDIYMLIDHDLNIQHECPALGQSILIAPRQGDKDCYMQGLPHPHDANQSPHNTCGFILRTHSVCAVCTFVVSADVVHVCSWTQVPKSTFGVYKLSLLESLQCAIKEYQIPEMNVQAPDLDNMDITVDHHSETESLQLGDYPMGTFRNISSQQTVTYSSDNDSEHENDHNEDDNSSKVDKGHAYDSLFQPRSAFLGDRRKNRGRCDSGLFDDDEKGAMRSDSDLNNLSSLSSQLSRLMQQFRQQAEAQDGSMSEPQKVPLSKVHAVKCFTCSLLQSVIEK